MPEQTVHRVYSLQGGTLLIDSGGDFQIVLNEISDSVSRGDLVVVDFSDTTPRATSIFQSRNPNGSIGIVKEVLDEKVIVEKDSATIVIEKPEQEISTGWTIQLDAFNDFYSVILEEPVDLDPIQIDVTGLSRGDTDPSDLNPDTLPDKDYDDFGGMDRVVKEVKNKVELPLKEPELFDEAGIEAPKGVLFYGPPGTGKTHLAQIAANQIEGNSFFSLRGPELSHKLVGETERQLRETFEQAREVAPAIIFFDELDSIAPRRDKTRDVGRRTVGQLLTLLDGLEPRGQIIVIGSTNQLEMIDPALRRPGRFNREIEFQRPTKLGRREILEIHKPAIPFAPDVSLDKIAEMTNGWTGADLKGLFDEVGELLIQEERVGEENAVIHWIDIQIAYERVQQQITNKEAQRRKEQESRGK